MEENETRGWDNEHEYCIGANAVVYTSRCELVGKNIFARCIFYRVTHDTTHGPFHVENGHGRREFT